MGITKPQIPKELAPIEHFYDYGQDCLSEEITISEIRTNDEDIHGGAFPKIEIRNSLFENATFYDCSFEGATFIDVMFQTCDLSNSKFTGAFFERCQFVSCKCIGINMGETVIRQTTFTQTNLRYSFFDKTKMTEVLFDNVDFTEAYMAEGKLKKFEATDTKFIKNNFFKTLLATVDFTKNQFAAPIISTPPTELKGAVIDMFQAADLMALWGVIVKK